MEELDPKLKTWGTILGVVALAVVGLDFVVLKGQPVDSGRVSLRSDSPPAVLSIARPGEKHLVEISTRRHHNGKSVGQTISYRLVGPDGATLVEASEIISHKKRFFDFVPATAGEYSLHSTLR